MDIVDKASSRKFITNLLGYSILSVLLFIACIIGVFYFAEINNWSIEGEGKYVGAVKVEKTSETWTGKSVADFIENQADTEYVDVFVTHGTETYLYNVSHPFEGEGVMSDGLYHASVTRASGGEVIQYYFVLD